MRLDPLYTVTFTTPETWSVEVASDAGIEGRSFLLAEGRSTGRLSARYRAANFPRKRSDGALVPEFRGVLETDDGRVILFEWQGLAVLSASGMRQLLGSLVHTTDDPRYRWLNDRVCAVEGEVRLCSELTRTLQNDQVNAFGLSAVHREPIVLVTVI